MHVSFPQQTPFACCLHLFYRDSRAVDSNRVYSPARGSVVNLMATHLISEMFQSEPMWKNDRHAINMCFPCANKVNLCLPGIKTCGTSIFQP